jgi:hypothetical protein
MINSIFPEAAFPVDLRVYNFEELKRAFGLA